MSYSFISEWYLGHKDEGFRFSPVVAMNYAVKVRDTVCLITSDGRLFGLDDAVSEGFALKHDTVDTSRFSAKGYAVVSRNPALFYLIEQLSYRVIQP